MPVPISPVGSSAPPQLNAVMASSFVRDKFAWLHQVRVDPDLTPLAFVLAYVLAEFVNEGKGCAWPGIARLAAECRVTERGIKKVIRRLVERGHLHVEIDVGRGWTNRYPPYGLRIRRGNSEWLALLRSAYKGELLFWGVENATKFGLEECTIGELCPNWDAALPEPRSKQGRFGTIGSMPWKPGCGAAFAASLRSFWKRNSPPRLGGTGTNGRSWASASVSLRHTALRTRPRARIVATRRSAFANAYRHVRRFRPEPLTFRDHSAGTALPSP